MGKHIPAIFPKRNNDLGIRNDKKDRQDTKPFVHGEILYKSTAHLYYTFQFRCSSIRR